MSQRRTGSLAKCLGCCLLLPMVFASLGCGNPAQEDAVETPAVSEPLDTADRENPPASESTAEQPSVEPSTWAEPALPDGGGAMDTETSEEAVASEQPGNSPAVDDPSTPSPARSEVPVDSSAGTTPPAETGDESLDARLAAVEIPPAWLADVQTTYDTSKPWKDARLEIRRLLGLGKPESHREAIKLTWIYLQKDDMNDGHEYPMYTFMGGEPLWSIRAHQWYLEQPHENTPVHSYMTLAALYAKYGEFERAKQQLDTAMGGLPDPPWRIMREADLAAAYGDLYTAWGRPDEAKQYYERAILLYPTAKPPYGGHLLPRRAAKVQSKLDVMALRSLATATLRDGQYRDKALGYAGDINVTVTIADGKIADIQLKHEEKIDQNACVLIPQQIVDQQSLQVDAISGATVTQQAIVNGVFRCLKKAGLQ